MANALTPQEIFNDFENRKVNIRKQLENKIREKIKHNQKDDIVYVLSKIINDITR